MANNSIFVTIFGNEKPLTRSLLTAQSSIGQFTSAVTGASGISSKAFTGIAAAAGLAAVASGKMFLSFEDQMTKSTAIMGDVNADLRADMERTARDVAKSSTYGASEAAEAYYFLASAGLDAKQSMAALPAVTKFATAGAFDLARATDLVTDAQSALGLSVDDSSKNLENMTRVSDVLVKANTLANASVEQFSESLTNKAGAAIKVVGKDIEEGVAVLAAFADQGIKGAESGTALSIVMRDLQTKALKNASVWEELGLAAFDANGEMRNMGDIVADLEGRLDGMSDAQQKATLLQLGFSDKSVSFIQALLGQSDAIKEYEEALRSAGGTTQEVADKQLESLSNRLKVGLIAPLEDAAITLGSTFTPALVTAAEAIGGVIAYFPDFINGLSLIPGEAVKTAAAVGAIVIAYKNYAKALELISAHPVIAGLAVTAGAIAFIGKESRLSKQAVDDLQDSISDLGSIDGTRSHFEKLFLDNEALQEALEESGVSFNEFVDGMTGSDSDFETLKANLKSTAGFTDYLTVEWGGLNRELLRQRAAFQQVNHDLPKARDLLAENEAQAAGFSSAAEMAAESARDLAWQTLNQGEAAEEAAEATQTETEAVLALLDATRRAADPMYELWRSHERLAESQRTVQELTDDGKHGTDEWKAAVLDAAQAAADFEYAQGRAGIATGEARSALVEQLTLLGLTGAEIQTIIGSIDELNARNIDPKTFILRVLGGGTGNTGDTNVYGSGPTAHFHGGGVVGKPRSDEVDARLRKGEVVRTAEQEAALARNLAGGGGNQQPIEVKLYLDTEVVARALINRELGLA